MLITGTSVHYIQHGYTLLRIRTFNRTRNNNSVVSVVLCRLQGLDIHIRNVIDDLQGVPNNKYKIRILLNFKEVTKHGLYIQNLQHRACRYFQNAPQREYKGKNWTLADNTGQL